MKRIPWNVRLGMFLRSFLVQGSWNYETLIGTGFAFSLLPILRHLHAEEARVDEAVERHVELFNSHPYLVSVAVGAVARLEAEGAEPTVIQRFKLALRGSLGSLGDRLIWTTWRPMCALVGIALLLLGGTWWVAVGTFLVTYNAMHLCVRAYGLKAGLDAGLEVGRVIRESPLQRAIDVASRLACLFVGFTAVLSVGLADGDPVAVAFALVAIGFGLRFGYHARRIMIATLAAVAVFALLLGLAGYGA